MFSSWACGSVTSIRQFFWSWLVSFILAVSCRTESLGCWGNSVLCPTRPVLQQTLPCKLSWWRQRSKNKEEPKGLSILQASEGFTFTNTSLVKGSHMTQYGARVGSASRFFGKGQGLRNTWQMVAIFVVTLYFLRIHQIESNYAPSVLGSSQDKEPCLWIHI